MGDVWFVQIVLRNGAQYFAAETTLRDAAASLGGKKIATLLGISSFRRELSREGYRATTFTVEVADVPDAAGNRRWAGLSASATLERAYVAAYKCYAPHGTIVGTPFRMVAGVVMEGGFEASTGFRFKFSCVDILGDRFSDPNNQPQIPPHPLTIAEFAGMDPSFDGKVAGRVLGNNQEAGVGATPVIYMGQINLSVAPFQGANELRDVLLISEGAVYDITKGYYNPPVWAADSVQEVGDIVRPTPGNANGFVFKATVAGTTGGTEPTWPGVGTVADGGVTWAVYGDDDPLLRYEIPADAYPAVIAVPHMPGWSAATGLPNQFVDYPSADHYNGRRYTPALVLSTHRYARAIREGRISVTFDVIGAMEDVKSGDPILKFSYVYTHLLLNYYFYETNGIDYGTMPMLPGLDGGYSVVDTDSADAAETVGDAWGGLTVGMMLGARGETEAFFEVLAKLQRGGFLEVGPNRHGQLMFARRNTSAAATIHFSVLRDFHTSGYRPDKERRGTRVEHRFGYRYGSPVAPTAAPAPGDPQVPVDKLKTYGDWSSGEQKQISEAAETALGRIKRIQLDNYATRDAFTAAIVAQRELAYGIGPSPAYDGTRLFTLTGPLDLLLREDSNGKTRELNDVILITDYDGLSATGYVEKKGRITAIEVTPPTASGQAAEVTLEGDILE